MLDWTVYWHVHLLNLDWSLMVVHYLDNVDQIRMMWWLRRSLWILCALRIVHGVRQTGRSHARCYALSRLRTAELGGSRCAPLTGWRERERPSLYVEDMTTRVLNGTLRERGQCRHASDKFVKQWEVTTSSLTHKSGRDEQKVRHRWSCHWARVPLFHRVVLSTTNVTDFL